MDTFLQLTGTVLVIMFAPMVIMNTIKSASERVADRVRRGPHHHAPHA